ALEVDEGDRLGGGHPAIHVVPGALAVAEERGLDGRRLLESIVAGYEVCSRIGGATTVRPNVHSHGTWGAIGTAVAVARLGDAAATTIREVINLAASMSPANTWTPALEGATIRNLYPGRSAWSGLLAAELHACGFTSLPDAPSDVYGTILADTYDPAPATMLAAKFAIPYAVAASLVLGRSDTAAFEPTALADPRIRDLARRVTVRTDASMSPRSLDQPTARVRVALRDGRMLEAGTTV